MKGKALSAISRVSLNKANYQQAIKHLQKRFANKQTFITLNIIQLLSILPVSSISEITKSRQLLDKVEYTVKTLKPQDGDTKQYGPVLILIVMSKLPESIIYDITCSLTVLVEWDVDD